jgi:hypothetical protein
MVTEEYSHRRWVVARCDYERERFRESLERMRRAGSPGDVGYHLVFAVAYVAGIIAVAHLRQPTHRRCLVLMKELLAPRGRLDLCEEALAVAGWAHLTRPQVEVFLDEAMRAFDRAVEVYRTPVPYGFKLRPHVRPYFAKGAREIMRGGHHREAMWWIWVCHGIASGALRTDAPDEEKPVFQAGTDRLLADMGLSDPENWPARAEQAEALADEVFQLAEQIVAYDPDIVD